MGKHWGFSTRERSDVNTMLVISLVIGVMAQFYAMA